MEHFIGIDAGGWLDKVIALVVAVAAQLDGVATQRLESLRGLKRTYESVLPR